MARVKFSRENSRRAALCVSTICAATSESFIARAEIVADAISSMLQVSRYVPAPAGRVTPVSRLIMGNRPACRHVTTAVDVASLHEGAMKQKHLRMTCPKAGLLGESQP